MSYNIFDGAVDKLSEIVSVVHDASPDFLALNEANTFASNDKKILKMFAQQTGFPYFTLAYSGKDDFHVAVFSKFPFLELHTLSSFARACIIAVVDSPQGPICIASSHLNPSSEDLRQQEVERILAFQKNYIHRVLMGDMNSLSDQDNYEDTFARLFNLKQKKKFTSDGKLRFDVIRRILSAGYIDCAVHCSQNKDFTVPTPANRDIAHSRMRLDYIFISPSLVNSLRSYGVVKNSLTHIASDHYPVRVEL